MSINALNWAMGQDGLKPAAKLVLVCLADCHNAHTKRCDPSQDTLSRVCGMSRSTLNLHLNSLEELGLIQRIKRSDKHTKRQKSSLYILGSDGCDKQDIDKAVSENRTRKTGKAVSEKQAKPCPKNKQSRVRPFGHKPELNPKGTMRARKKASFFTFDERSEAKAIAEHVLKGGGVNLEHISVRVRLCLRELKLLTDDQLAKIGLA
jgi:DNA-binding HxlR family transcriptional regulator